MTARETTSEADDERGVPASRRSFLQLAGSVAGVGLAVAPTSADSGGGADAEVRIAASPSHLGTVRDVVQTIRQDHDGADLAARNVETTAGLERLATGAADVVVGSRPMLPAERSRVGDNGVDFERREVPTATGTLRQPAASWVDCLRSDGLVERWTTDGPVETWAEVPPPSATAAVTRTEAVEEAAVTAVSDTPGAHAGQRVDGDVVVRGVRPAQYASGFGGVGYYEPDSDWLTASERVDDSGTSLVRLAYLYVDRDSLQRTPVEEFVTTYTSRSVARVGTVSYFAHPAGGD